MMTEIKGVKKQAKKIRDIRNVSKRVVAILYDVGQDIELSAERSITNGSVSGKGHFPSSPGQPPNRDTGLLDRSIETTIVAQNPPTVHVTSHAPYSAALEFGTSRMAERPFMRPATAKHRREIATKIATAVKITVRKG